MSLWCGFYSLSVFGAGVGREDCCETLPPGAQLQEQGPLEPRDSDHEEVSVVKNHLPVFTKNRMNKLQSAWMLFLCVVVSPCYRLNHVNVVQAREVPEELSAIALNDLPLLSMEYCSRGDLRKVSCGYFIKILNS